jgi:peptidoglycan/LPS O-acetylase OafA/YrhL
LALYLTKFFFLLSLVLMFIAFLAGKADTIFNLFTSWIGYACFYLYGGLVANRWIIFSRQKINLILIGLGFATTMIGDFITGWAKINQVPFAWVDYTGNFLSLPVILMAVGLFNYLISAKLNWLKSGAKNLITWLAGLSYGLYLIHTYVVSFLTDMISFNFDQISMNVYLYITTNFLLVLGASLFLTLIIKATPKLKLILGES